MEQSGSLTLDWQGFAELALIVAAVSSMFTCVMMLRQQSRIEKRWETAVRELTNYLGSLSVTVKEVENRLAAVEADTANVMREQRELEATAPAMDNVRHAITLVERGWKAKDVVDACGLTRTEADLICLLHGGSAKKGNGVHTDARR